MRAQQNDMLGDIEACSSRKIWKFRGHKITSETIYGQYNASRRPDDSKFQHGTCVLGGVVWVSAKQWR